MKRNIIIDDIDINILAELTDINAHTEARLKLAGLLNESRMMQCYDAINTLHKYFGSLSYELSTIRDKMDMYLFRALEEKCNLDDVNKIKNSL